MIVRAWCALVLVGAQLVSAYAPREVLWRDPGSPEQLDFAGTFDPDLHLPTPPFRFEKEDLSGTQTKLLVRDARGALWNVKFGFEVKSESFAWRIVRACGYFVEPNFFVANGVIRNLPPKLQRASPSLQPDGHFTEARFQPRIPKYEFLADRSWHWNTNPFHESPELKGLKMLLMLVSNFDNKDSRVGPAGGPNTGVFRLTSSGGSDLFYAFTDWGSTMGRWGDTDGQSDWNCPDFSAQSREFVKGVRDGHIVFGFQGHIPDFNDGITPADAAWLMLRLARITDAQLRTGLAASGATIAEVDCFARALRARITALHAVAGQGR